VGITGTFTSSRLPQTQRRASQDCQLAGAQCYPLGPLDRHPLGSPTKEMGCGPGLTGRLRLRDCHLGTGPPGLPTAAPSSRGHRRAPGGGGACFGTGGFWRPKRDPNPTDRAQAGSKHHLLADGRGVPRGARLRATNGNDLIQALVLVAAIPPRRGKRGRPRRRPGPVPEERGYDSEPWRAALRRHRIRPVLGRGGQPRSSGLGDYRWVEGA